MSGSYSSTTYSQYFQPNFVLVDYQSPRENSVNLFGDIVPFYKNQAVSDVVVSSQEALENLVWYSRVVVICVLSLVEEILHNAVYQGYLLACASLEEVSKTPRIAKYLKNQIVENWQALSDARNREFWWLEVKIETKQRLRQLLQALRTFFQVVQKFYLAGMVVGLLVGLQMVGSSGQLNSVSQSNILTQALNNHSYQDPSAPLKSSNSVVSLTGLSTQASSSEGEDNDFFSRINTHEVKEGESLEQIAALYGLKTKTVAFNNQVEVGDDLPDELYIPWTDGYIYQAESAISPQDLEDIYHIDKKKIYSENEAIFDQEKGKFPEDSNIFLPTTDFEKIKEYNKEEQQRKENLRKAKEEKRRKQRLLEKSRRQTYANKVAEQRREAGFIWPTQGNISRCVVGNHVACDIAHRGRPPIFAAQNGTVSRVYRHNVSGFGLAVVIDHGNGLKTLYAHMSEIYVSSGEQVKQGQSIGRMGNTGFSTGTHLHFEVRQNGNRQNPLNYLP
jgi:murein DD-endopeptidase MepM/ murein hydrolase activator NlpD